MKVVTMCQGGHVRSVGLKYILHYKYGHDVLSCGWQANPPETLVMLFTWAESIVIMQKEMIQYVPLEFHPKTIAYDVGPDNFGTPFHPALQQGLLGIIKHHGFFVPEGYEEPSALIVPENAKPSQLILP